MDLTDEQWKVLERLIGALPKRTDSRGRPRSRSREVLNGILWILRTGAQWPDLPDRYPPYQTCHCRLQRWVQGRHVRAYFGSSRPGLERAGQTGFVRMFYRRYLCGGENGGGCVGPRHSGQRFDAHGNGRPFWSSFRRLCLLGFARAQVTLVAPTLDSRFVDDLPRRLIGDRGYDADPLDAALERLGPLLGKNSLCHALIYCNIGNGDYSSGLVPWVCYRCRVEA
jgi:hypothetical protein